MGDIRFLLKVSRPRFWVYALGPFILGLTAASVTRADLISTKALIYGAFFLFPANLLIYGVNDIFDYETDKLNTKKFKYETLVEPNQRKRLLIYIAIFNIPFIAAAFWISPQAVPALAGFLFFSIFYSAPPIRAKSKPFLDSVFNILYVFPGAFAYLMVSGKNPPIAALVAAGLWTFAMHAYSAIPDIESDTKAKIKTIATQLGGPATLGLCLMLYVSSGLLTLNYLGFLSLIFTLTYAVMIFFSYRFINTNGIFTVYKFFPYINAATGFVMFWYIALNKFH